MKVGDVVVLGDRLPMEVEIIDIDYHRDFYTIKHENGETTEVSGEFMHTMFSRYVKQA